MHKPDTWRQISLIQPKDIKDNANSDLKVALQLLSYTEVTTTIVSVYLKLLKTTSQILYIVGKKSSLMSDEN